MKPAEQLELRCIAQRGSSRIGPRSQLKADDAQDSRQLEHGDGSDEASLDPADLGVGQTNRATHCCLA